MAGGSLHGDLRLRCDFLLRHCLFRLGGQVNTALLADNLIVPVNVRDQFPGRLVDGLQTGPQLR